MEILSNLNPFDLENVAKTFNKQLYIAASPTLAPLIPWVRSARRMSSLFRIPSNPLVLPTFPRHIGPFQWGQRNQLSQDEYGRLGLDPSAGPYIFHGPPDLRWMNLDGSFRWLEPLDEMTADEMEPHTGREGDHPILTTEEYELIARKADETGLTLPRGFKKFATSDRLHHRVPSHTACYFDISRIIKCPPKVDNDAGGYLMRFYCDQQGCGFSYLYMNRSGDHCVICSYADAYVGVNPEIGAEGEEKDTDPEEYEDEDPDFEHLVNESFTIAGLTFEEYIVSVYYEELLNFKSTPTKGLKDYVSHVYKKHNLENEVSTTPNHYPQSPN